MSDDATNAGGACLRCGYDLTGLDDRRPCPECGLLAGFSRMDPRELANNHPRWLRRLSVGAGVVSISLLAFAAVPAAVGVLDRHIEMVPYYRATVPGTVMSGLGAYWRTAALIDHAVTGAYLAAILLPPVGVAVGLWLLMTRGRGEAGGASRWIVRGLSTVPTALILALAAREVDRRGVVPHVDAAVTALAVSMPLLLAVVFAL